MPQTSFKVGGPGFPHIGNVRFKMACPDLDRCRGSALNFWISMRLLHARQTRTLRRYGYDPTRYVRRRRTLRRWERTP